jgi:RNA polymerase sigma-70 factor (ECF subfamily)
MSSVSQPPRGYGELSALTGAGSDQQGRARLIRWIARHHGARVESEDILHDAFVRFEQQRRRAMVSDPIGFLLHTAANLVIDDYRRRRTRRLAGDDGELARIPDPRPAMEDILSARSRLERAERVLDALSERTRAVFLMHRLEGRKQGEIARALGISTSAVEKHIAKAACLMMQLSE